MRRREFTTLLVGAAAAWPLAARAQQRAMPVIGYLAPRAAGESPQLAAAYHGGLKEIGLTDGRNVAIEYRYADNHIERLPELANDLVHRKVNVMAAFSTVAARAAKAATGAIPIVFLTGEDPVAAGLVAKINRPEGNLTGISFISSTLGAKRLQVLRALVPNAELIAVLVDPNASESRTMSQDVEEAAKTVKQPIVILEIRTPTDFDAAFATIRKRAIRGFLLTGSPFTNARMDQVIAQAERGAIAALYTNRDFVLAGGLISYGTSITDAYRQAAIYSGRVIRGERTEDLPILLPTKFELAINLKTAKTLGIEIPPTLLALADEVIE